ncbi:MAG TPA: ATP phosphoribosyltransferase regulatory subunit, partial [Aliiroseovarius sp.]|nr:ATP phosphoribosyltransferase regulatory subunit [Aliiroseovarius sp.]
MADRAAIRDEAQRLLAHMERAGAARVDTDILQPADVLLDLYGEDIRARAFTTHDPEAGEMMLRPDFTVPVVRAHMENGAEPARYGYAGKVFRAQGDLVGRTREYWQVGFELFDGTDVAAADAEVFALFHDLLAPVGLKPVTGDMGLLLAAVRGLNTTERRKAALLRHIWRPRRFRALLDRFAGRTPPPEGRAALLSGRAEITAPVIGLRTRDEIEARIAALIEDAAEPPIA